ncbi:hypothetical protein LK08_17930 [Streptomyces sp. MUSC 125]|nr:hypothetical protein LK08_17930 [Streptomyces sp. MUSC 125]
MTNDMDALLTALYVKIDDEIGDTRWLGRPSRSTDSELVCLAMAQAIPGFTSERRWLRLFRCRLRSMFPYVPKQAGWDGRLRAVSPRVRAPTGLGLVAYGVVPPGTLPAYGACSPPATARLRSSGTNRPRPSTCPNRHVPALVRRAHP